MFIQTELAFEDFDSTIKFLEEHKAAHFTNPSSSNAEKILECKPIATHLAQVYEEKYRRVGIKGAV